MQEGVRWTNLTREEIAQGLADEGYPVSVTVVDRLLEATHMGQRQPQKIKAMAHDPDRDEMVRDLSRRATTKTGLHVYSRTLRGLYETGHRASGSTAS